MEVKVFWLSEVDRGGIGVGVTFRKLDFSGEFDGLPLSERIPTSILFVLASKAFPNLIQRPFRIFNFGK